MNRCAFLKGSPFIGCPNHDSACTYHSFYPITLVPFLTLVNIPFTNVNISDLPLPTLCVHNTSNMAIKGALMQMTSVNWYRAVYYASQCLSRTEKNYSNTECEALEIIHRIKKLGHSFGTSYSMKIYIPGRLLGPVVFGHQVVVDWHIGTMGSTFTRIRIRHTPLARVQHAIADYLSRLESEEPIETV